MDKPMVAKCRCAEVTLELDPPTLFASYCHCDSCRVTHASPFVGWTAVPNAQLRVTAGEPRLVAYLSSPGVTRSFCGRCGTPMLYRGDDAKDRVYVPVAILDHLDRPMESHVSYEERPEWARGLQRLPCHIGKGGPLLRWE